MKDAVYARMLGRTYFHRVTAYRPGEEGEEMVCFREKCALSRSAHTNAPAPPRREWVIPEAESRYALYTDPALVFALGDRLEITDPAGRVHHGRASDSFCYPSHCVTVVEVAEVLCPAETGADSCEFCPEEGGAL